MLCEPLAAKPLNLLTYLLTPWCRVLPEQLTGLQLVKKFPAFHGTRRFELLSVFRKGILLSLTMTDMYPTCDSSMLEFTPWSQWFLIGAVIKVEVPKNDVWYYLAGIKTHGLIITLITFNCCISQDKKSWRQVQKN